MTSRRKQPKKAPHQNKPLIEMSEIELRKTFDDMDSGSDSFLGGMLDEARTSASAESVRISVVALLLPDGEERYIFANSEYGDDEGRENAASCLRLCSYLNVVARGENFERLLIETRLADLHTTRTVDPVATDEGHRWLGNRTDGDEERFARSNEPWIKRVNEARGRKEDIHVSLGVLSMSNGVRRVFSDSVEYGANEEGVGRLLVGNNIRTSRRLGLLNEGETLERFMLEIGLAPLRVVLRPDPLAVAERTR